MSKIFAKDSFDLQNWQVNFDELGSYSALLYIGFTDKSPIVVFDNLSFGFEVHKDNNVQQKKSYPPSGVKYIRSDQEYLVCEKIENLLPTESYDLFLWANNGGITFQNTFTFSVPIPNSPYPSWVWSDEEYMWYPPIPKPEDTDEYIYLWDEETLQWIKSN